MSDSCEMHIIAHLYNDFRTKFGVPRQSGLAEVPARIVFTPPYRNPDALRGIEGFSHLWLIWQFSEAVRDAWSPTVRPPRLGGNTRMGVFATRSPYRPNALGLSCVRLCGIEHTENEGDVLVVSGADLMNGTPLVDVKPYLAYTDSHPDAAEGFTAAPFHELSIDFPPELAEKIPPEKLSALCAALRQDPRPQYHRDPERVYGLPFGQWDVRFTVAGDTLTVKEVAAADG